MSLVVVTPNVLVTNPQALPAADVAASSPPPRPAVKSTAPAAATAAPGIRLRAVPLATGAP